MEIDAKLHIAISDENLVKTVEPLVCYMANCMHG